MNRQEIQIPVTIGGVTFKNPFFVASGPTTKTVRQLQCIEETGWAAASIKLSIDPAPYINRKPRYAIFEETGALAFTAEKRLTFAEGLELVREAKKVLTDLKLLANITYAGEAGAEGWVNMAKQFEEAGADVIELNMCCPNMSYNVSLTSGGHQQAAKQTGASLGQQKEAVAEIVHAIKKEIHIPLFVKLTPEGGQIAPIAAALYEAGADAVGGTGNRLGMPKIDLEHPKKAVYQLQEEISMSCYSGGWLKPLAQRDTYEIRKVCGREPKIMAAGGITDWQDAVEMVLCGGNLLGVCAETLIRGYDIVRPMVQGMKEYMDRHGYQTIDDFCGQIVDKVRTAPELTLYDGYARIKEPRLSGPCKVACPLHVPVQDYVKKIAEGRFRDAYDIISKQGVLQSACAYLCPHPCEEACVRGDGGDPVRIRELKRFVLEMGRRNHWAEENVQPENNGYKAAVVGSGPMGLACAQALAKGGYRVTVFEKAQRLGGAMLQTVESTRLPAEVLEAMLEGERALGIEFRTGAAVTAEQLRRQGYSLIAEAGSASEMGAYGVKGRPLPQDLKYLKGKSVILYGRSMAVFDIALVFQKAGARVAIVRNIREKSRSFLELKEEVEKQGIRVLSGLTWNEGEGGAGFFRGEADELVILPFDACYQLDAPSQGDTIVAAAARGVNLAAKLDQELRGAAATLVSIEGCIPVKKEKVLRRSGYLGDSKLAQKEILTEEQAVAEASRCLHCGCGEGCQLCKSICTDFAPYIAKDGCIAIDPKSCVACGMCYHRCPNHNIEMVNRGRTI